MLITHGLASGQVLQRLGHRGATVDIRGASVQEGDIHVRITAGTRTLSGWRRCKVGCAARGGFFARLKGLPTGGPYMITLSIGRESLTIRQVYVGDVWVLAGQSNMQGYGNLDGAPAPHPKVHAMYMDDRWDIAREPIHFLAESFDRVHYQVYGIRPLSLGERRRLRRRLVKGTSVGIYFGREMVKRSGGVPQGLICCAHGGTSMEQWDPEKKHLGGDSLYGSMLRMVRKTGQPVSAALWYQGESDASNAETVSLYTDRMKKFVTEIRRDFRQPRLPFLTVQLGRVMGTAWNAKLWNGIQVQQAQLGRHIRYLECVSAIDLPLDDPIHIGSEGYPRLGARLARLADRLVYGNRREPPAPELVSILRVRDKQGVKTCAYELDLTFKNVVGGLRAGGMPSGFALVDGEYRNPNAIFKTTLRGNTARVATTLAANHGEYKLMYGHGAAPFANITDARDMPVPVFGLEPIDRSLALAPFIEKWLLSSVQLITRPLTSLPAPRRSAALKLRKRRFAGFFVDMHPLWNGRKGHGFFFTEITLAERMRLNLCLGYDGPIRIWVDDRPFFTDLHGTNPATPDEIIRPLSLGRGKHRITVAMDLNNGLAWGFFMRFDRRDVTRIRGAVKPCALPVCSL